MASQQLLEQLHQALSRSESFKLLPVERQEFLKKSLENASDQQIEQVLEELKKADLEAYKNSVAQKQQEEKRTEAAQNLKVELIQVKKEELKEDEAEDALESSKAADHLLAEINQKDGSAITKKRKKFLGIF